MARFEESNICPICGGRLIASPIVLTSYPPQFQATCEKCGKTFTSYHHIGCSPVELVDSGMWCNDEQCVAKDNNLNGSFDSITSVSSEKNIKPVTISIVVDDDFDPDYYRENNDVIIEYRGMDRFNEPIYTIIGDKDEVNSFIREAYRHIKEMC